MNEYLVSLKQKYNYSDEMIQILSKIIDSFIKVLGEENKDRVFNTFYNVPIFVYDNVAQAGEMLKKIFNNDKEYRIKSVAAGFVEDEYFLDENNELKQQLAVGIKGYDEESISTLAHEMCHAMSFAAPKIVDGKLKAITGFNTTFYEFDGKYKGEEIADKHTYFNETITENLAMQIMDVYNNTKEHGPSAYNGIVNAYKGVFRNEAVNPVLINDYLNQTTNFLDIVDELLSQEEYQNIVAGFYSYCEGKENYEGYLADIANLSVKEFLMYYINRSNDLMKRYPKEEKEFEKFKAVIDRSVMYHISESLSKVKQYQ